jgi:DNA-binding transcriptional regulator YdaS (Cro superfamily)
MDIKKAIVSGNREWSPSTQKKLASMLGVSAATVLASAALTACDTTSATSGNVVEPTSSEQTTCGEMPCDWEYNESSSSVAQSSSSQTNFSSSIDPVGGISSSSDAPRPVSSSYEIDTLEVTSGEVIPPEIVGPESGSNIDTGHLESSSSIAEPSSSSYQRIESSSTTSGLPLSSSEAIPGDPIEIDDPKD